MSQYYKWTKATDQSEFIRYEWEGDGPTIAAIGKRRGHPCERTESYGTPVTWALFLVVDGAETPFTTLYGETSPYDLPDELMLEPHNKRIAIRTLSWWVRTNPNAASRVETFRAEGLLPSALGDHTTTPTEATTEP